MLRIATFNLENLFTRPTAMSGDSDAVGRPAIEHHAELNAIACKPQYSDEDKARLVELSNYYGFHLLNAPADALVRLQKIRGRLFHKPEDGSCSPRSRTATSRSRCANETRPIPRANEGRDRRDPRARTVTGLGHRFQTP